MEQTKVIIQTMALLHEFFQKKNPKTCYNSLSLKSKTLPRSAQFLTDFMCGIVFMVTTGPNVFFLFICFLVF
jgi:hypothetical protein